MAIPKTKIVVQGYPRIEEAGSQADGLLDDRELAQHARVVPINDLPQLILLAIEHANKKSSREMLSISKEASDDEKAVAYRKMGIDLFKYFRHYSSDPASTAFQLHGQNCREVALQQFRNKALQKERMNAGWRYQYLAIDCAQRTRRFVSVSELGLTEADFNAVVEITKTKKPLSLYVSVKNRANTIGGPDWPNAIQALENLAVTDRNRHGPYICVFAFVIESGGRSVKRTKDRSLRSPNTELWASDFFWPFFANYTYEQIMQTVLQVLMTNPQAEKASPEVPQEIIDTFEENCKRAGLVDERGIFNDPATLVKFFCSQHISNQRKRINGEKKIAGDRSSSARKTRSRK